MKYLTVIQAKCLGIGKFLVHCIHLSPQGERTSNLDTQILYCEDNLSALTRLPAESVDLVYLDPPFFSKRIYEVIWGDEAEVRSFEDRWDGGINHSVGWMRDRVRGLHRVLKPSGSIYLHSDPRASHYLKVMLDEIFGPERFRSEIIWKRSSAHNDGKQGRQQHGRIHDVILYYTKGESWTWNTLHTPTSRATSMPSIAMLNQKPADSTD